MRGIRLTLGLLVAALGRFSFADDATPAPAAIPPQPVAQQSASPDSPAQKLLREKLAQRDTLQREIEELAQATGTAQQILVRVQMMEVDLTKLHALGMDVEISSLFRRATGVADLGSVPVGQFSSDNRASVIQVDVISEQQAFRAFLGLLKQHGLANTFAEPTLVTTSGRAAAFKVGAEYPVPSADPNHPVEYQNVGTELSLVATSLGNQRVRLEVKPKVTQIDAAHSIVAAGKKFPAFHVMQIDTSCEATLGETVGLSGLIQERVFTTKDKAGKPLQETAKFAQMVFVTTELAVAPPEPASAVYTPPTAPRDEARFGSRPATTR